MRLIRDFSASIFLLLCLAGPAASQGNDARALLERSAEAMGGLRPLRNIRTLTMTGFGQYVSQDGGGNPSPDPRAPSKWQAANGVERIYDLAGRRVYTSDRRGNLFPFAARSGHSWALSERVQSGAAVLDHPLPVLLAALADDASLGAVAVEGDDLVIEVTQAGTTFWLAVDNRTALPAWVRRIGPSATLGDVTTTIYFTGYLPFDEIELPVGFSTAIDWRDTTTSFFHVDSYGINQDELPAVEERSGPAQGTAPRAQAEQLADGVWDIRIGGNGGAVIEFDDHLTMFEVYGSEAASFARIDLANTLVPGKQVSEVIVSHHHFDHSGGLRAAVARGLTIISRRGNEAIFREMVARPAPNFPDALARNPRPLNFVPVDEHLVLEDSTARVDVYHAVGHTHMAEAVFAYVPAHRIFLEGDFTTYNWDFNWWGDAYLDSVERYGLQPAVNVPVHGIVTTFEEAVASIARQAGQAREFCAANERAGIYMAGCPVQYSGAQ